MIKKKGLESRKRRAPDFSGWWVAGNFSIISGANIGELIRKPGASIRSSV